MTVIELGEKIAKEIDSILGGRIISAVVYGADIHKEVPHAKDCNLVIVLDKVDLESINSIKTVLNNYTTHCSKAPLIVQKDEIEGMMDSVPIGFWEILLSYQTVYGKSLFKGLSSLNHEHLRAQIEQKLRENLFSARKMLMAGLYGKEEMLKQGRSIRDLFGKSLQLYYILNKPWLSDEDERMNSFMEDFTPEDILFRKYMKEDLSKLTETDLQKIALCLMDMGFKPLLAKVDEMGP